MYGHILCPQYILCPILYIQYPTHTYRAKQGYTQLYTAWTTIHGYTELDRAIQGYTQLYRAIHSYTELYRAIHCYTGLCTAIHGYTQLYRAKRSYTEL